MSHVPPMVQSSTVDGPAYLLAWERLPEGSWGARIAWMEIDDDSWTARVTRVAADAITKLDGQDYSQVPRRDTAAPATA
ncbi:hypothetical protein GCM10009678_37420 [Actinomadura kijaniata]|uniref:Uncharacterized protein n=1 Tax=Actinomadura namibiensis TaxID=182080 RepID=A0A7W3LZ94_ACTNM|nr:hypothetical protein [Actinomadura namibiensis]MBA8957094.1 hypothetical protein [Actinomadura namibiensis]